MTLLTIQALVVLLLVVAGLAAVARRINVPLAILLVFAGVALALIPGLPALELAPQLVLFVVLPLIIYWSAFTMSWREFRRHLRSISLLAVGCVMFTTLTVAGAAHWLLGFPWAVGFVLGAIVSPPDEVAPLAIARRIRLPSRIMVILEGEGLANDATSLVLYRIAIAAVGVSAFSLGHAAAEFTAIVIGEILWGIGIGWSILRLRSVVGDSHIEILLSFLTPFMAFWPPEALGGSGVLATVAAGLYVSWNGPYLISAATRLQGVFFWDFLTYLIEGMVFLITGLQARTLISRLENYSIGELLMQGAIICATVILTRFFWVFSSAFMQRRMTPSQRHEASPFQWQAPFLLAFTGIRGLVSLAVALAIPLTTGTGSPFPYRDTILFLTFTVILVTLGGQGLALPLVIRWLGLANAGHDESRREMDQEAAARRKAIDAGLDRIAQIEKEKKIAGQLLERFRAQYSDRHRQLERRSESDEGSRKFVKRHDEIDYLLIATEREAVNALYRDNRLSDEARRRLEYELDLRESYLTKVREGHGPVIEPEGIDGLAGAG